MQAKTPWALFAADYTPGAASAELLSELLYAAVGDDDEYGDDDLEEILEFDEDEADEFGIEEEGYDEYDDEESGEEGYFEEDYDPYENGENAPFEEGEEMEFGEEEYDDEE